MSRSARHHPFRPKAYLLFDVMLAIALFGVFIAIIMQLARVSLRVSRDSGAVAAREARFDGVLTQLRRDAWGAAGFQTPAERTLKIDRSAGAPAITWTVTEQGGFVRTSGDDKQEWTDLAASKSKFEVEGKLAMLVVNGDRRVPLASQLAEGVRP